MKSTTPIPWFLLPALVLALQAIPLAPAQAQTEAELQEMYVRYLDKKGLSPEVDQDGDVTFDYDEKHYFIDVHAKDKEFFMIVLPNIWPIESASERIEVLKAADHTNNNTKSAKVFTKGDDVWISIEMFVADPRDFSLIFDRALTAIESAVEAFVTKMKEN